MNDRTISSLLIAFAYALVLALALIACGAPGGLSSFPPSSVDSSSAGMTPPSQAPLSPCGQPSSSQPGGTSQSGASQAQGSAMEKACRDALEGIYRDHIYPTGDPVDVPEWAEMEKNHFAIFDVDGDGDQELLYRNGDSTMAGMSTSIYSFDEISGKLYLELSGFVGMTFYDNGIIRVEASHNHGLSAREDFWPYALYQYDMGGDGYLMTGYVDAWSKDTFPEDFEGSPFPDGVDQDGDGMIYLVTFGGQEVAATQLDGPDYEKWLNAYIGGASELEVPWQAMTSENIQAVAGLSFPF